MAEVPVLESFPILNEASLLGLPRELRLQIYDHVLVIDLNYTVLNQWQDTYTAELGFKSVPELNEDEELTVPWVNLMLVCRAIARELRSVMRESSCLEHEEKRTYVLDLEATRGGLALGASTWKRLPCAPEQVRILEAYYNASSGFQAWGVGGQHGITSGLYQTLNHLVWCGPRLDSTRMLKSPMHLKELRIVVENRGTEENHDEHAHHTLSDRDTDPETTLYALGSIVGQMNRTGVLRGFIDKIRLSTGDKVLHWSPADSEGSGIPEDWARYGFDWGMSLYRHA